MKDSKDNTKTRIESKLEVNTYLQKLKYALDHDAQIAFQARRLVDKKREIYYGTDDVYIKIRVELLGLDGNTTTFVMSFHFAEKPFTTDMFPYKES